MPAGRLGWIGGIASFGYTAFNGRRGWNLGTSIKSDLHDIARGQYTPDIGRTQSGMFWNNLFNPANQIRAESINRMPYNEYIEYKQRLDAQRRAEDAAAEASAKRWNQRIKPWADAFGNMQFLR
ncbi:MAG: hypothetical protein LBH00_10970 [Planctomycetaceae bacterium]|jgi:hypothetical protein|nr:hypothetical protein [Planctomycetaceae bacterium]